MGVLMATVISYIAFTAMAVVGFLIAYFSFDIYRLTKGGSKGWKYMAYGCIPMGVYAIWGVFDTMLQFSIPYRLEFLLLMTGLCVFMLQIFLPLGTQGIGKDIGARLPGWYTSRNILVFLAVIFLGLVAYNFMLPIAGVADEIVSIGFFSLAVMSGVCAVGYLAIARSTKKSAWWLLFLASLFMLLGFPGYQMYGDCCGSAGWVAQMEFTNPDCYGFINDYAFSAVIHGSCIPALLPLANYSMVSIIIATILYFIAFTMIWRSIKSL